MAKLTFPAIAAIFATIGAAAIAQQFRLEAQAVVVAGDPFGEPVADDSAAGRETSEDEADPALLTKPRLEMVNGDSYTGELLDSGEPDVIAWQSDAATSPWRFSLKNVSAAHFPREGAAPRTTGAFCFELAGGDTMFGALVDLSDEAVEVDAKHFGRLRIVRNQVRRIQRWGDDNGIEYLGPDGLVRWTESPPGRVWREEAGHIVADKPGALTLSQCEIPAQAGVEVELSWKRKADFSLAFGASGGGLQALGEQLATAIGQRPAANRAAGAANKSPAFELSVWSGSLVLVREGKEDADLAPVQQLGSGAGRIALQLYFDQAKGEAAAYSIDGKLLARVKVAGEPDLLNFGVRLTNKRGDVRLERLLVRRWNGAAPTAIPVDKQYVERTDGSLLVAEEMSFDPQRQELVVPLAGGEERIPIGDVAGVALPTPVNGAPASVRAALHDGVRVSGKLDRIVDGKLRISRPGVAEPLELSIAALQSLVAVTPSAPPPTPDAGEGRLETAGLKSRGRLVDAEATAEGSCLAWQPYGSETGATLRADLSGRIVYREPPPPVQLPQNVRAAQMRRLGNRGVVLFGAGRVVINNNGGQVVINNGEPPAPEAQFGLIQHSTEQLLWLRAGDRIPCKLLAIDERGVTFETPLVEATFLPHDAIKAWDRIAGSQPRPLDEQKFNRLLTLPRMQRDNPPTHLIESTRGDFLRGRIDSLGEDALVVELRLEKKRIPRDNVARIIWFDDPSKPAGEAGPRDDASDAPPPAEMRVQVVRSDGVRLSFEPQKFEEGVLWGASALLGACHAPVDKIDQILIGGAIAEAASELAYAQWRLRAAADPRFVSEDGQPPADGALDGTESALVGKPAPDIRLELLEGGTLQLDRMRGKVVVLDFWATWCGWCMQSMPEIAAMANEFDDRVVLMPINLQEDKATITAGLERLGVDQRSAMDVDGAAAEHFGVTAIPQTVIVGADGNVTHVFVGGGPEVVGQLRAAIREALGEGDDSAAESDEEPAGGE